MRFSYVDVKGEKRYMDESDSVLNWHYDDPPVRYDSASADPDYNFDAPAAFLQRECGKAFRAALLKGVEEQLVKEEVMGDGLNLIDILGLITGDRFEIDKAIFNNPATIVYWRDGTKTVVTDMDNVVDGKAKPAESYSKEEGLALCFMKKALGNKGNYNNAFRKWCPEEN